MIEVLTNSLVLPIALPIAAGVFCFILPRGVCSTWATIISAVTMVLCWPFLGAAPQTADIFPWFSLRLDMLSRFIVFAVAFFGFLISLYSTSFMKDKKRLNEYYAYLLLTIGASAGALLANDFILLLVFWGFTALLLYLMGGITGPSSAQSSKKSFIILGASDSLLIFAIAIIYVLCKTTRMDSVHLQFDGLLQYCAAFGFIAAAAAKAGAVPLHGWVPDFGEKSAASVSAFLPASLDKLMGIYLLVRCVLNIFEHNSVINMAIMTIGAVTIISAVLMALVQHDMKRLLSFHAVSQVGYMFLAIGTGSMLGIAAGLFHMLNNTFFKSSLFLCVGSVEKQTGTTDLDNLGGLAKLMPLTFITCLVASLSISGIPPFNGFASKWMIYQSIVDLGKEGGFIWVVWLAAAMLGSALTLASFVKILHAVFLCKPSPTVAAKHIHESAASMWIPMMVLATLCIVTGIFAWKLPLSHLIIPAVGGPITSIGTWSSGAATVLLLTAIAIGIVVYALTTVSKTKTHATYIGGEILQDAYISNGATGAARHVEVTGVDFYLTIKNLPIISGLYHAAGKKWFDLYKIGSVTIMYFIGLLRKAHNGLLLVYLTWVLVGILGIAAFIFSRGN